jgi:hypothetical protein
METHDFLIERRTIMDEEMRQKLNEAISEELEELKMLQLGSEEHVKGSESIEKLYKVALADMKNQIDIAQQEIDESTEMAKIRKDKEAMAEEKRDRYVRYVLDGVKIIAPLMLYSIWMKRGFEFEKDGTFTSTTFRNLFQKIKPEK